MSPSVFLDEVVLPTVQEFLRARGDRRLAYLCSISAFHLCDYVHRAERIAVSEVRLAIRTRCPTSFDVIEGVCNGSKHAGADRPAFKHLPGSEREIPATGYGVGGGYGSMRYGGSPGLLVDYNDRSVFIDLCLLDFLRAAADAFPAHLSAAAEL